MLAVTSMPEHPFVRLLTLSFGSAAVMWFFSYVAVLQPGSLAGEVLFGCSVLALFGGGVLAGRLAMAGRCLSSGLVQGLLVGLLVATINLLLVAGLVRSSLVGGVPWIIGILVGCIAISGLGGLVGAAMPSVSPRERWSSLFCWVATGLTFFMIVSGGVVTGFEAGLAVPDWPNSYGHNMLLYPLSEMVVNLESGVFYEHSHRLTGMFVGLTSLVLLGVLMRSQPTRWVRMLGVLVLIMVIVQGVLGGLRVTGILTFSQDPTILAPSTALAIVHGVFAQVIMATMALAATATSHRWSERGFAQDSRTGSERTIASFLVLLLLVQLGVGAAYRHLASGTQLGPRDGGALSLLMVHITLAAVVAILTIAVGIQALSRGGVMRRMGIVLLVLVGLQLILGVGAVVGVYVPAQGEQAASTPGWAVLLTSVHQANGALLLMAATVTAAWAGRLWKAPAPAA